MPDWLIEILRQSPMVVVIGLAIWYAEKRVSEKEVRLEERADRHATELQGSEDQTRSSKSAHRPNSFRGEQSPYGTDRFSVCAWP